MYNFKFVAAFRFPVHLLLTNTTYKNIKKITSCEEHEGKHFLNRPYCEYI